MNIINFHVNKGIKNFSKNKHNNKQFLLPSLNPNKDNNHKKTIIPFQYGINKNQNINKPMNNINNQLKKQRNNIQNKIYEQQKLFKNHKPYSGNPSIKCNNNIIEMNKPIKYNNNQLNLEREIFTANPSLIASKNNFNNNNEYNNNLYNNNNNKNQE